MRVVKKPIERTKEEKKKEKKDWPSPIKLEGLSELFLSYLSALLVASSSFGPIISAIHSVPDIIWQFNHGFDYLSSDLQTRNDRYLMFLDGPKFHFVFYFCFVQQSDQFSGKMYTTRWFIVLLVSSLMGYRSTVDGSKNAVEEVGHSRLAKSCSGEMSGEFLEQWYQHAQLVFTANVDHIDRRGGALNVTLRRIIRSTIQVPFRYVLSLKLEPSISVLLHFWFLFFFTNNIILQPLKWVDLKRNQNLIWLLRISLVTAPKYPQFG